MMSNLDTSQKNFAVMNGRHLPVSGAIWISDPLAPRVVPYSGACRGVFESATVTCYADRRSHFQAIIGRGLEILVPITID